MGLKETTKDNTLDKVYDIFLENKKINFDNNEIGQLVAYRVGQQPRKIIIEKKPIIRSNFHEHNALSRNQLH